MQEIESFLKKYISHEEKYILGCSTGADSMYLLHKIMGTSYKDNLVICYFNHKTRPECEEEEKYILEFGKKHDIVVEIAECDFDKIKKLYPSKSFEELAREKRYQFFDAACHLHTANIILTAHHLDDRIETMIFNMLRGTKLTGLINMTEKSGNILRPLLRTQKKEIYQYLNENDILYFEDSSNSNNDYTRNYLRNQVLPMFESVHPEHRKNLSHLVEYFEEVRHHLDKEVNVFLGEGEYFSVSKFFMLTPLLQKEVIRYVYYLSNGNSTVGLSEGNIAEVIRFINGKNNKTKKEIHDMNLFKDGDKLYY